MWKQLSALVRGHGFEAAERVTDGHALTILNQQIRDCAAAVSAARKAVALGIAQNSQEEMQLTRLKARITDLESRAIAALQSDKQDLAREAAGMIAILETELTAADGAQQTFKAEMERQKRNLAASETRLQALYRGQRLAAATKQTQSLRDGAANGLSSLGDAEATLSRLRTRQTEIDATDAIIDEMDLAKDPTALCEKLAKAGCGPRVIQDADSILERLRTRISTPL